MGEDGHQKNSWRRENLTAIRDPMATTAFGEFHGVIDVFEMSHD